MKFKNWDGKSLSGPWTITVKIDGIQAQKHNGVALTKGGNPLYNMPKRLPAFDVAEVYCGSWNETDSIVRSSKSKRRQVRRNEIYRILPDIDPRLNVGVFTDPDARLIRLAFEQALAGEAEGLVLRQGDTFIKVKKSYTEDVRVTGFIEGKGKFKGMLGKFKTESGDVGTGFTSSQRKMFWDARKSKAWKNLIIEVKGMEKTEKGKIRQPRFIRLRLDKC